jgi:hypothetical protein
MVFAKRLSGSQYTSDNNMGAERWDCRMISVQRLDHVKLSNIDSHLRDIALSPNEQQLAEDAVRARTLSVLARAKANSPIRQPYRP